METPGGGSGGRGGSGGNAGTGGGGSTGGGDAAAARPSATTPGMPRRFDAALYASRASSKDSAVAGGDATCKNTGELDSGTPTAAPSLAPSSGGSSSGGSGGGSSSSGGGKSSSSPLPDNSSAPGSVTPGSASSGSTEPSSPEAEGLQRARSALTPSVLEMQRELQTVQRELQDLHRKREQRKTR